MTTPTKHDAAKGENGIDEMDADKKRVGLQMVVGGFGSIDCPRHQPLCARKNGKKEKDATKSEDSRATASASSTGGGRQLEKPNVDEMPTPRQLFGDGDLISAGDIQAMREGRVNDSCPQLGPVGDQPTAEQPAWLAHMERIFEKQGQRLERLLGKQAQRITILGGALPPTARRTQSKTQRLRCSRRS